MIAFETPKQRCEIKACYAVGRMAFRLRVMLGSCLVGVILLWCVAAQAQIVRSQGPDGRLYFTNLPLPPASGSTAVTRPALATRPTAQAPIFSLIQRLAQQYSVDPHLVRAIITVESNFDPHAVSRAGAQGLMQLMPDTAVRYRVENPFDPHANIEGGIRYLRDLLRLFPSDLRHVLAAYNAGEGAVQQYGGMPPYPETQRYVERVLTLYGVVSPPAQGKIYRYRTASGSILLTDTPR
jgi:soluble lytic murein transglycosylase-like protein